MENPLRGEAERINEMIKIYDRELGEYKKIFNSFTKIYPFGGDTSHLDMPKGAQETYSKLVETTRYLLERERQISEDIYFLINQIPYKVRSPEPKTKGSLTTKFLIFAADGLRNHVFTIFRKYSIIDDEKGFKDISETGLAAEISDMVVDYSNIFDTMRNKFVNDSLNRFYTGWAESQKAKKMLDI
jgi:hypothetical protein